MYRMRCKYCGSIDSRPSCLAGAWPVLARPGSQQGSARRGCVRSWADSSEIEPNTCANTGIGGVGEWVAWVANAHVEVVLAAGVL